MQIQGASAPEVIVQKSDAEIRILLDAQKRKGWIRIRPFLTSLSKKLTHKAHAAWIGLVLGLVGSVFTVQFIRNMLYGTQPLDWTIFATVAALLLLVAATAWAIPAWRASRLDPVQAVRME